MAYTAVPTVSTGDTWTASNHNTYLKDNISYLYTQVSAQFWLGAGGAISSSTNGATKGVGELGTNDVDLVRMVFDPSTKKYCFWEFTLPSDYDGGTITATFYWLHPAASSYAVKWGLSARAFANSDALDQAFGTAQEVVDTGGTTNDLYMSSISSAITIGGSPAASQFCVFRAHRDAADGEDTLNVNAYLLGVMVGYTRT